MRNRLRIAATTLAAAGVFAAPADAATASFSVNPMGAFAEGGASVGQFGIALPNDGGQFSFAFVLPRDYEADTPVTIALYLRTVSTECSFAVRPGGVNRHRPGFPRDSTNAGVFEPKNGEELVDAPAGSGDPVTKAFVVMPGGNLPGMRRGDAILVLFTRSTDADDTCTGSIFVVGIDVRYKTS